MSHCETIKYIDGNRNERTFNTERNELNGGQMWWFEPHPAMYAGTVRDAKYIAKQIRQNFEVLG